MQYYGDIFLLSSSLLESLQIILMSVDMVSLLGPTLEKYGTMG